MENHSEKRTYEKDEHGPKVPSGWMKIGLIAAASVALGGMATAWWYRKTLIRMRQAGESHSNPQFGISESDSADEV